LAFATVMAMGLVGQVHAVTPASQDTPDSPPTEKRRHPAGVEEDREATHPVKRAERPDALRSPEQHGKVQAGNVQAGKAQAEQSRGVKGRAKGLGFAPQGGDKKARGAAAPVAVVPPVPKATPAPPAKESPARESGEPPAKIPRFAALKTDDTNMRKGPGQRYPIEWVYKRRDLPMEVEREYDVWRYVRDPDGVEGWVHQVTLSDRRTFIVQTKDATLRADPNDTAAAVAMLKVGVVGRLRACDGGSTWCQVQVSGYRGYLRRDQFWGLLPDEVVGPS
jgi:SH3-like domain-containing protein